MAIDLRFQGESLPFEVLQVLEMVSQDGAQGAVQFAAPLGPAVPFRRAIPRGGRA